MPAATHLVLACAALALLCFAVGLRMLAVRVAEMKARRVPMQAVATSVQVAARLEDTRAADNFRNLFEVPVLFYALVACALASGHTPGWLVAGAWAFVGLRVLHSAIHCSYNRVAHRFAVFMLGFALVVGLWLGLAAGLVLRG